VETQPRARRREGPEVQLLRAREKLTSGIAISANGTGSTQGRLPPAESRTTVRNNLRTIEIDVRTASPGSKIEHAEAIDSGSTAP
jgi:hypothetical protein